MRHVKRLLLPLVAIVAFVASTANPVYAQAPFTSTWGDWTNTGSSTNGYTSGTVSGSAGSATLTSGTATITAAWPIKLGFVSGGTGTLSVSGTGNLLKWASGSANYIYDGYNGVGTLNVTGGASVTNTTDYVGYNNNSTGTLNITSGGSVTTTNGWIGYNSGATGAAYVDGASKWANTTLYVGGSATGTLSVTNGGLVSDTTGYIGYASGLAAGTVSVNSSSSTSKWTNTTLYAGYSGAGTLNIASGGSVSDTNGYIGYNPTASGTVSVDGTGIWTNTTGLYVGGGASTVGAGTLNITNGGAASAATAYLGYYSGSSGTLSITNGGTVTVTGNLYVGDNGTGALNISGGSVSVAGTTYIAYAATSTGSASFSGGTLTTKGLYATATAWSAMTGTGTINTRGLVSDQSLIFDGTTPATTGFGTGGTATVNMSATSGNGDLGVGYASNATLTIQNGANVYATNGYLGYNTGSSGTATVNGSTWNNSGALYVGYNGNGQLNIPNGAVTVTGMTSVAYSGTNTAAIGAINFNGGTLTTGALYAAGSALTGSGSITTTALVSDLNLAFNAAGSCSTTFGTGGNATVNMSATSAQGDLGVGYAGTATLAIQNGANVYSLNGWLGVLANSAGTATVSSNSLWSNTGGFTVGNAGNGTLNIQSGGTVSATTTNTIANAAGSTGSVTVDGAGSLWSCVQRLTVGGLGTATLTVTHGGTITSKDSAIGYDATGAGTITIDGTGSAPGSTCWLAGPLGFGLHTTAATMYLGGRSGTSGGTGTLNILNGGYVSSQGCNMANLPSSVAVVLVSGAGSTWNMGGTSGPTNGGGLVSGGLTIDQAGTGTVTVTNGGFVSATSISLGYTTNGSGTLNILNGGTVTCTSAYTAEDPGVGMYIGQAAGGGGTVTVDGTGSAVGNTQLTMGAFGAYSDLVIGSANSTNNLLTIKNGGAVADTNGWVGYPGSSGTATVDGPGSTWTNWGTVYVGNGNGSSGQLNITRGGTVSDTGGSISDNLGTVMVDGAGSTWSNSGPLTVGANGSGTLNITNGGAVSDTTGYIGYATSFSASSVATVDGANSTWTNSSELYVGYGHLAALNITNGGAVSDTNGYIGYYYPYTSPCAGDRGRRQLDVDQQRDARNWRPGIRNAEHYQRRQGCHQWHYRRLGRDDRQFQRRHPPGLQCRQRHLDRTGNRRL